MKTLLVTPTMKSLEDFIAIRESAGNYNAVIGNANSTNDLSRLTIDGIYSLQDQLLAQGRPSTAVGRYQFLKRTLGGLVAQLEIDRSTLFTPPLQDMLAGQLLVTRGYPAWLAKQLTDPQFAHNLSCEWASLPDPDNGGRSHYDGDSAGNHAGQTLDAVYAALSSARAATGAPAAAPVPGAPAAAVHPAPPPYRVDPRLITAFGQIASMLQSQLTAAKLYTGPIDSDWGPGSRAALQQYQTRPR